MTAQLKDILAPLTEMQSVIGVMIIDQDGLVMENTFPEDQDTDLLGSIYAILELNVQGQLVKLGESANQIFFSTDEKLILVQKIEDVILVLYTQKNNLDELQSRLLSVARQIVQFLHMSSQGA
ncbi:MAG: roadblock/LC7 domain-containing protein [Bacteroidetes bacterium]|nr:roadblock/LC7 domain-containing protein [Bacteroidota bacterium]